MEPEHFDEKYIYGPIKKRPYIGVAILAVSVLLIIFWIGRGDPTEVEELRARLDKLEQQIDSNNQQAGTPNVTNNSAPGFSQNHLSTLETQRQQQEQINEINRQQNARDYQMNSDQHFKNLNESLSNIQATGDQHFKNLNESLNNLQRTADNDFKSQLDSNKLFK